MKNVQHCTFSIQDQSTAVILLLLHLHRPNIIFHHHSLSSLSSLFDGNILYIYLLFSMGIGYFHICGEHRTLNYNKNTQP